MLMFNNLIGPIVLEKAEKGSTFIALERIIHADAFPGTVQKNGTGDFRVIPI